MESLNNTLVMCPHPLSLVPIKQGSDTLELRQRGAVRLSIGKEIL